MIRASLILACALASRAVRAETTAPTVVLLRASTADTELWSGGMRAVIAEILATGYELRVRTLGEVDEARIEAELTVSATEPGTVGAVAVLRRGDQGFALVRMAKAELVRVEGDALGGTVSESRVALRVVQLLRDVDMPEFEQQQKPPAQKPVEPVRPPEQRFQFWIGAGAVFASDIETPFPWAVLTAAYTLWRPLGVEASLGAAPFAAHARTTAGDLQLHAQQASLYLMFDPFVERDFGVALGLGGGAVLIQESARASLGFRARDDATRVAMLGARARVFGRSGTASFVLWLEPGLLFPQVSVRAGNEDTLRIGRPWISTGLGVGWSL